MLRKIVKTLQWTFFPFWDFFTGTSVHGEPAGEQAFSIQPDSIGIGRRCAGPGLVTRLGAAVRNRRIPLGGLYLYFFGPEIVNAS